MKNLFRSAALFSILLLSFGLLIGQSSSSGAKDAKIDSTQIKYFSIGSANNNIGKLKFVGGIELESDKKNFGGLSGLRFTPDGSRLYAVSDRGFWLTAEIKRSKKGRIKKLKKADLSCLCKADGTPYPSKHWADAEGVEILGDKAFVVFERLNRINGYSLKDNNRPGPPKQATTSFRSKNIAYNNGLEAMAIAPAASPIAGKFLAIAEESLNDQGNNRAFIATKTTIEELSISRSDDYSITDATFLPNGDLLILERRFGLSIGLGTRIRKFSSDTIKSGALLDGEILMEAGLTSRIDNMEGITTWQTPEGNTRIAIISDDNYNRRLQRTLLLEFELND